MPSLGIVATEGAERVMLPPTSLSVRRQLTCPLRPLTQPSRAQGGRYCTQRKAAISPGLIAWSVRGRWEQLGDALLVEARDVRASAVESALQLGALAHELVAFEQQRLILVA
jgi:hypothetical protein